MTRARFLLRDVAFAAAAAACDSPRDNVQSTTADEHGGSTAPGDGGTGQGVGGLGSGRPSGVVDAGTVIEVPSGGSPSGGAFGGPGAGADSTGGTANPGATGIVNEFGDVSRDPNVDDPSPDYEGAYREYFIQASDLYFELRVRCLHASADYAVWSGFVAEREEWLRLLSDDYVGSLEKAEAAGRFSFDPDTAGAWLAHLGSIDCTTFLRESALSRSSFSTDPLNGGVPRGGLCAFAEECADPNDFCGMNANACPAYWCTPRSQLGEACTPGVCVADLYCDRTLTNSVCQAARTPDGGACQFSLDCERGSICSRGRCKVYQAFAPCATNADCPELQVCSGLLGMETGTCGGPKGLGESCRAQSTTHDCAVGLDCLLGEDATTTCVTRWAELGERCGGAEIEHSISCIQGWCDVFNSETEEGTCAPYDGEGDACSLGSCAPAFECTTEGCASAVRECRSIGACDVGSLCVDAACVSGTPPGDDCTSDDDCGWGAACIGNACERCD